MTRDYTPGKRYEMRPVNPGANVPRSVILAERGSISTWVAFTSHGDVYSGGCDDVLARFGADSTVDFLPTIEDHRSDDEIVADLKSAIQRLVEQGDVEQAAALAVVIDTPVPDGASEDYRIAEILIEHYNDDRLFDEISGWLAGGFTSTDVADWVDSGCGSESATQLRDAGFSPADAALTIPDDWEWEDFMEYESVGCTLTRGDIDIRTAIGTIRLLKDGVPPELNLVPALNVTIESATGEKPDRSAFRALAYIVGTSIVQSSWPDSP